MKELGIFDLYEKSSEKTEKEFIDRTDSYLRVQINYEKLMNDTDWIELMEETIPYIDNIFRNPNRFIINEEEIVKIELARKITVESIKHLSKNTNLIQDYNKQTGDVRPSKILNINKEESYDTYENRIIYTLIQNMKFYISQMKKKAEEVKNVKEKNEKRLEYKASSKISGEKINVNVELEKKLDEQNKKNDNKEENILERIEKLEERIVDVSSSEVYKAIDKKHITLVRSPIKKTNVVLKNVNFQYAMRLWNFLQEEIDDKTKHINEKEDYMDNSELKKMMDETFLLQYLTMNTLEKDNLENEESNKKLTEQTINQMLERVMDLDTNITENQLKEMIANKYEVIKYRNIATINEIQKVFKKHIEKYINN